MRIDPLMPVVTFILHYTLMRRDELNNARGSHAGFVDGPCDQPFGACSVHAEPTNQPTPQPFQTSAA